MGKIIFTWMIFFLFLHISLCQAKIGLIQDVLPAIENKIDSCEYLCLGEYSHGDMETHYLKSRIVTTIMNHKKGNLFLFESPLVASVIAYINNYDFTYFVYPFWNRKNLIDSLLPVINNKFNYCLGFDPQETCNFKDFSGFFLERYKLNDTCYFLMQEIDSLLSIGIITQSSPKNRLLTVNERNLIKEDINKVQHYFNSIPNVPDFEKSLINLCFENRKYLAGFLTIKKTRQKLNYRDAIMAKNILKIDSLCNTLPNDEINIIWTADYHIKKVTKKRYRNMISYLIPNFSLISVSVSNRGKSRNLKKFDFIIKQDKSEFMSQDEFTHCY